MPTIRTYVGSQGLIAINFSYHLYYNVGDQENTQTLQSVLPTCSVRVMTVTETVLISEIPSNSDETVTETALTSVWQSTPSLSAQRSAIVTEPVMQTVLISATPTSLSYTVMGIVLQASASNSVPCPQSSAAAQAWMGVAIITFALLIASTLVCSLVLGYLLRSHTMVAHQEQVTRTPSVSIRKGSRLNCHCDNEYASCTKAKV